MDEGKSFPEQSSKPKTKRKRVRKRVRIFQNLEPRSKPENERRVRKRKRYEQKVRHSSRTPKWEKRFNVHEKWTLTEKSRLLEALKRYDADNISSIAQIVGTKTAEEVDDKIKQIRGTKTLKGTNERVDALGPEKAPIEAWIDLVQEMTKHECADYSLFVTKFLGIITRNEQFADSGYPDLKWRNIYQFLGDITADKVEVHKLTDIESLMVLDLMHSLGDTLLNSDTSEQRQILDFKFNLLNFKATNAKEKEINYYRIAQALGNDFWEPEDLQRLLLQANKSAASTDSQASNTQNNGSGEINVAKTGENRASSGVKLLYGKRLGEKFLRPKFFTLNPLCVPTQMLAFQPKAQNE